jgi:hypothetical protein
MRRARWLAACTSKTSPSASLRASRGCSTDAAGALSLDGPNENSPRRPLRPAARAFRAGGDDIRMEKLDDTASQCRWRQRQTAWCASAACCPLQRAQPLAAVTPCVHAACDRWPLNIRGRTKSSATQTFRRAGLRDSPGGGRLTPLKQTLGSGPPHGGY